MVLPRWLVVKNPPANAGDARVTGSTPGSGRSPCTGNGNLFQCSCLENSMYKRAWQTTVHGIEKSWTWPSDWERAHTHTHTPTDSNMVRTEKRQHVIYALLWTIWNLNSSWDLSSPIREWTGTPCSVKSSPLGCQGSPNSFWSWRCSIPHLTTSLVLGISVSILFA